MEIFKLEIIAVPLIRHADWMVRNVDFKDNKKNHDVMMFFLNLNFIKLPTE